MNQDARRRLEDLLDREIELARVLAATLAAERTALTGDSPAAVEAKRRREDSRSAKPSKNSRKNAARCAHSPTSPGIAATVVERWRA